MTRQVSPSVAPAAADADLDGRLHLRDRAAEEEVALAAQVVGETQLQELRPAPP